MNISVVEAPLSKEGLELYNIPMFFAIFFQEVLLLCSEVKYWCNKTPRYLIDSSHFTVIEYKF